MALLHSDERGALIQFSQDSESRTSHLSAAAALPSKESVCFRVFSFSFKRKSALFTVYCRPGERNFLKLDPGEGAGGKGAAPFDLRRRLGSLREMKPSSRFFGVVELN